MKAILKRPRVTRLPPAGSASHASDIPQHALPYNRRCPVASMLCTSVNMNALWQSRPHWQVQLQHLPELLCECLLM